MAAPISLLIGRGFQVPGTYDPNAPQIAVPFDPGQTNRVARGSAPALPSDEPPAPMIEAPIEHAPHPGYDPNGYEPGAAPAPVAPTVPAQPGAMTPEQMDAIERQAANPEGPSPAPEQGFWARLAHNFQAGGNRVGVPMAGFPASSRYSSTRPEFIYTNPQAAQQAASNYAARLGFESAQDQGYRDYLSRINESQQMTDRFGRQTIAQQQALQQQLAANASEGAANRASNEKIAGMAEASRAFRQAEQEWMANERAAETGDQTAAMLNDPAADPIAKQKADKRYVWINPATGKYESRYKRRPRPAPPQFGTGATPAAPTEPMPAPPVGVPQPQAQPAPAAPAPQSGGFWNTVGNVLGWTSPTMLPFMISRAMRGSTPAAPVTPAVPAQ